MPTLNITWVANKDGRLCDTCRSLDGYEWVFVDDMPEWLYHPEFGMVWDLLADQSRAHGYGLFNCRCTLNIDVDDTDVLEQLDVLDSQIAGVTDDLDSSLNYVNTFLGWLMS